MTLGTLAFTIMNTMVKHLLKYDVYQVVFFRGLGSLIITMALIYKMKLPILGNKKKLLIFRALTGTLSMTLFFASMKYLSAATAVSLRYLAPIFSAIFAIYFLREKIKLPQWFFFLISFTGVVILKGLDTNVNNIGLTLILAAAVITGLVYISISKIGTQDHSLIIINYFMLTATVFGGLMAIPYWKNPVGLDWALFMVLGVFGFIGQYFMTKAFQIGANNLVAPLKYLEVLFTGILGFLWLGEVYTMYSLIGILLIVSGLVANVVYKSKYRA